MAAERGGGALPVGARDPEDRLGDEAGSQLHLPDQLDPTRARLDEDGERERNAGARHHQIDPAQGLRSHPPELAPERQLLVVRRYDLRAARTKQAGGGLAALAQGHHEAGSAGGANPRISDRRPGARATEET